VTTSAASSAGPVQMVALAGSYPGAPAGASLEGAHNPQAQLAVEVVIPPSDQELTQADLTAMYDPKSPSFHHWLAAGPSSPAWNHVA
jgi:hypothetical protein